MLRRSVSSGMRRPVALRRRCCAPLALALLILLLPRVSTAQAPALAPPGSATEKPSLPTLPPPPQDRPIPTRTLPAPTGQRPAEPAATTPPLPPPSSEKTPEARTAKPSDDLATALERTGTLNLHGVQLDKA